MTDSNFFLPNFNQQGIKTAPDGGGDCCGVLEKKSRHFGKFRRRWTVLKNNRLCTFNRKEKLTEDIKLTNYSNVLKTGTITFAIYRNSKPQFEFRCVDERIKTAWIKYIKQAIQKPYLNRLIDENKLRRYSKPTQQTHAVQDQNRVYAQNKRAHHRNNNNNSDVSELSCGAVSFVTTKSTQNGFLGALGMMGSSANPGISNNYIQTRLNFQTIPEVTNLQLQQCPEFWTAKFMHKPNDNHPELMLYTREPFFENDQIIRIDLICLEAKFVKTQTQTETQNSDTQNTDTNANNANTNTDTGASESEPLAKHLQKKRQRQCQVRLQSKCWGDFCNFEIYEKEYPVTKTLPEITQFCLDYQQSHERYVLLDNNCRTFMLALCTWLDIQYPKAYPLEETWYEIREKSRKLLRVPMPKWTPKPQRNRHARGSINSMAISSIDIDDSVNADEDTAFTLKLPLNPIATTVFWLHRGIVHRSILENHKAIDGLISKKVLKVVDSYLRPDTVSHFEAHPKSLVFIKCADRKPGLSSNSLKFTLEFERSTHEWQQLTVGMDVERKMEAEADADADADVDDECNSDGGNNNNKNDCNRNDNVLEFVFYMFSVSYSQMEDLEKLITNGNILHSFFKRKSNCYLKRGTETDIGLWCQYLQLLFDNMRICKKQYIYDTFHFEIGVRQLLINIATNMLCKLEDARNK